MKQFKEEQSLDDYILMFENIYEPIQNVERDFNKILARLLEAIAQCSQYVNKHNQQGLADNLPKVFSWYSSLVHKSGISCKLSDALWRKFPLCCPYCLKMPCQCQIIKKNLTDNADELEKKAKENIDSKPETLEDWQKMFAKLYPRDPQGYDQKSNFSHLIEELGEASEAYRIRYFSPSALESELADILTWILGMANLLNSHAIEGSVKNYSNYNLEEQVYKRYHGECPECKKIPCTCVLHHSKQKISELNVIYPDDIIKAIEETKVSINNNIKDLFSGPEIQNLLIDIKKQIENSDITEKHVEEIYKTLVVEPSYKKWYQKVTFEGMTESAIISMLTVLLQSVFK